MSAPIRPLGLVFLGVVLLAKTVCGQSVADVRTAVVRALPALERSASTFVARRSCVSCHHNVMPILTFHLARDRGFTIGDAALRGVEDKTFRELRGPAALDEAVQGSRVSDPTPNDSLLLMAAHAAGVPPSLTTAVYARRILGWQRDGHWVTSDFRPPHSSSVFTATATAIRAIGRFLPEELQEEGTRSIGRARAWLSSNRPHSTEDAAYRLMGLVWAAAGIEDRATATRDLLAMQTTGGGWPQLTGDAPDAYSTGEALFALREAGVAASAPSWRKGLRFLISTQARDGTWRVRSRMISPATVSPPFFEVGFPYGKDQFLSYAGSCWATMALLSALPATPPDTASGALSGPAVRVPGQAPADASARDTPPWVRTALFGTPAQLAARLDEGLDPNEQTKGGTSVIMMAAPDAEKVRLLLSRRADARHRSGSGSDALSIAASYRGTSSSLEQLITAGAEAEPPAGVAVKHTPLLFASMTGDEDNVRALLAHGADPNSGRGDTPLGSAVTFGHAGIVRLLVSAGAKVSATESSGINLLHWATITNRAAVIPVLVGAGVPIDAVDDNDFTPIMYAATIDFGDDDTVRALLQAGANPNIRNDRGRTARQQARHYHHTRLEAALR